jgi:hypothetical protein
MMVGPLTARAEFNVLLLFIQLYNPVIPPKLLTLGAFNPVPVFLAAYGSSFVIPSALVDE